MCSAPAVILYTMWNWISETLIKESRIAEVQNRRSQMVDGVLANHSRRKQPTIEWMKHRKNYVPHPSGLISPTPCWMCQGDGYGVASDPPEGLRYLTVSRLDAIDTEEEDDTWEGIRVAGLLEMDQAP